MPEKYKEVLAAANFYINHSGRVNDKTGGQFFV